MQDNHFTIEQLRQNLTNAGASEEALRAQITASIAWQKAVQDEYGDRVNITPEMVDAEMARYAEGANKPHYHVLEIFLPVDNPEQDAKVKKDAEEVETSCTRARPSRWWRASSASIPSAATGGDMGWVNDGQLAPELNAALAKMEVGAITDPIRSTGGYYVLALRERQEPLGTKIVRRAHRARRPGRHPAAGAPAVPGRSARAQGSSWSKIMKVAAQIQQHYAGCEPAGRTAQAR